jgi:hypothetical protein
MHCRFVFIIIINEDLFYLCPKNLNIILINIFPFFARFKHRAEFPWTAFNTSVGVVVITFLLGYIFYAAINCIAKVEDDYRQMRELKTRAEAADVAKSQVLYISGIVAFILHMFLFSCRFKDIYT